MHGWGLNPSLLLVELVLDASPLQDAPVELLRRPLLLPLLINS